CGSRCSGAFHGGARRPQQSRRLREQFPLVCVDVTAARNSRRSNMAKSPRSTGANRKIGRGPELVDKVSDEKAAGPAAGQAQGRAPSGPKVSAGENEPSDEAIRRLAYDMWDREARQAGRDREYWHRAKE